MHSTSWVIGPDSLYPPLGRGRKKSAPFSTSEFLALFVGNTFGLFLKKIARQQLSGFWGLHHEPQGTESLVEFPQKPRVGEISE